VLKRLLARFRRPAAKVEQRSRDDLHNYWRNANDDANAPELYLGVKDSQKKRSSFLVELVSAQVGRDAEILELGCNVGRNLHYLHQAGYSNLHAIEINEEAVRLLRESFPDTAATANIRCGTIEENIRSFGDGQIDLVFTMAVLEHVHDESAFVFQEMVRVGKTIVTVEDERSLSERHFPRNYRSIFESLGMVQVSETPLRQDTHGLSTNFVARVFRHPAGN